MQPGGWSTRLGGQPALARRPEGDIAAAILGAALDAVDPAAVVSRSASLNDIWLRIGDHALPLSPPARLWCIAAGKAAAPMARALVRRVGARLAGGVVVLPTSPRSPIDPAGRLVIVEGSHPVPDARSAQAGRAVLETARAVEPQDVVIVLLSGGASSLMVAPYDDVPLASLHPLGGALLRCGAPIEQVNAVRARLDRLKGGGLARAAAPARVVTLVLDDVVDAPLHVVGSGPTLPLPAGGPSGLDVLARHGISAPAEVLERLGRPMPETPSGRVVRLAGNDTAVAAARLAAEAAGWAVASLPPLRGEARAWGASVATRLARSRPSRRTAWIAGGETTVTVRGSGRGGRNQELALAALPGLAGLPGCRLIALSTDGVDGPTDAAGAVVDGDSLARARALGLEPARHLDDNDAYAMFDALEDLLRIGPTGTNVCDLVLALVDP